MKSNSDILKQFEKHKNLTLNLSKQYESMKEAQEFYDGDFMTYRTRMEGYRRGKRTEVPVQFNKVKPYVNAVKGFMAQNRRKGKFIARVQDDAQRVKYSENANSLHDYCRENANADHHETQADGDMLIGGIGVIETAMSYGDGYAVTDPNGEIIIGRLDPLSAGWNPAAREQNLLDSNFVYYKKAMELEEAMELQDADEGDFEGADPLKGDVRYNEGGGAYTGIRDFIESDEQELVNVYFYQWYEIDNYYRAANPLFDVTDPIQAQFIMMKLEEVAALNDEDSMFSMDARSKILNCNLEQKKLLEEFFESAINFGRYKRKVFYGAVLSGKKVFQKFKLVSQTGFTIKFKTGDYHASQGLWVGMVQSMKDPVLYYNKTLGELMYTIAAGSKGGVMYESDAVDDVQKFERDYARTNAAVKVRPGALSAGKIQPKKEPYVPNGLDALLGVFNQEVSDSNGIDKSFLGNSENKLETAALQRQRIKQVTSVLAPYFDSVNKYQREHARLMLDMMRVLAENNPGLMFLVTGDDGQVSLEPILPDAVMAEYAIAIEEAPETATEREEKAQILVTMGRDLISVGAPAAMALYSEAVKYMNLDGQSKQRVMQALMPDAEVDPEKEQLKQMVQELTGKANQLMMQKTESEIKLNAAKVDQTMADVHVKAADTVKKMEEADKLKVEAEVAKTAPVENNRVSV